MVAGIAEIVRKNFFYQEGIGPDHDLLRPRLRIHADLRFLVLGKF